MPFGTASARLLKRIIFDLMVKTNQQSCFQCGKPILRVEDMSIEHKTPWLSAPNPLEAFFDLDNIAFSHKPCNIGAAVSPLSKYRTPDQIREMWAEQKRRQYTTEKRRIKAERERSVKDRQLAGEAGLEPATHGLTIR